MPKTNEMLVTKHNDLIEASYRLKLEEQRLLLACIAQLDSRENADIPDTITVTAKEYADIFGIHLRHSYQQLKDSANSLYERDIKIKSLNTRKRQRWVYSISYNDSAGSVSLSFAPNLKPYLCQLNGYFKSYQIKNIGSLKSVHSIRLYELLNQWKETGTRFIRLNDFKDMLQLSDKYSLYADLRKSVIEPAIKELNQKTDFNVSFEPEKDGRKVVKLVFVFTVKQQEQ